jgi:hypothetical protein
VTLFGLKTIDYIMGALPNEAHDAWGIAANIASQFGGQFFVVVINISCGAIYHDSHTLRQLGGLTTSLAATLSSVQVQLH